MTQAPATAARTLNRAQIVEMGRQGSPWQFLPVAARALVQVPQDAGLRFLAAANFARLGLKTAASEHLDLLPPEVKGEAEVVKLAEILGNMADDRIPMQERVATCRANVMALAARGVNFSREFEAWSGMAARAECFRANDGNVIRRASGERDGAAWVHLGDAAGAARAFVESKVKGKPEALARPFTVEGCDPPWLLRELHGALPKQADGYWPAIRLVQADVNELLDGLSLAALEDVLGAARLSVFVGTDASERFAADLKAREGTTNVGPVLTSPGLRTKCGPAIDAVVRSAEAAQVERSAALGAEVRAAYDGRDRAWWKARYEAALSGKSEKLRVLVPTCRYSTFIKHSSEDLCVALNAAGFEARMLIEPDDSARFSTVAYLREFAMFKPDLVVLINYTRANMNGRVGAGGHGVIPENVPYVCWLQDAMPHQFAEGLGAKSGELDFLVGHLHDELFTKFGFTRERALGSPVVASEAKFHGGPVEESLARRMACDVAYVSHHSETPEAMHERLKRESAGDARIPRVFDALWPKVREAAARPEKQSISWSLREAALRALRDGLGEEPAPRTLTLAHKCYALPLADRMIRHETLRWAAEVCRGRGWTMNIYGSGWEKHPVFGKLAKGELKHDEELRAAYACAKVHLHASSGVQVHQRVLECVLSGGVMLSRLMHETVSPLRLAAIRAAKRRGEPGIDSECGRFKGFAVADHPELARWVSTLQRLGMAEGLNYLANGAAYCYPKDDAAPQPEMMGTELLGDLAETCFTSRESLEELIAAHVGSEGKRRGVSEWMAGRVRERYTYRAFGREVVGFLMSAL